MIVVERPRDAVDAGTTLQASTCRPRDPRVTGSHRLALRERLSPTSSLWRSLWSEERSKGKPSCERYPEVQTCPAVYIESTKKLSIMVHSNPSSSTDVLLYFLAIFVPPASVFIKRQCSADFWINVALFILGWIPGVIHAWWIISKHPDTSTAAHPHQHSQHENTPHGYQPVPNYGSVPPPPFK
ncbi:hypothetical protein PGT21_014358 [Puccinia graminis f. sp. tritici]|uniref:Plasma membrane proteolipid Pmp3 n=1 Tax=Puccinia graminis f. sp. tritici TaxID=56615 RepID=A0A5B0SDP7_PUCGR|nr:hypothetical protein PGT21_014358 [Puccinia graminis f. sp. tritici]KAA1136078.1 hypothetical protein PGTUg99_026923 [Puccinia graminis f. sp. tritici]